jgi:hypothetical protein
MKTRNDRRSFLTGAACSAGSVALLTRHATAGEDQDAREAAIEKAVRACRQRAREAEMASRARYFKPLVRRFGPGILDEVKAVTVEGARRSMQEAPLESRNLAAVKTELWDGLGPDFRYEVLEDTDETLQFKVTKCPLAEGMRRQEAGEIGFAFYCAWDYGFCEGLNPRVEFTRTKTLMSGDDNCDHRYRLRS